MNGLLLAIVLAATTQQNGVDHIMIGVPNLETGMAAFEKATGVKPVRGGLHPGRGTQNALVSLGDGTYLELIAPQVQPDAMTDRVKELQSLTAPTLLTWAERVSDVSAAREKLENAGFALTPPSPGSRNTPAGGHLEWTTFEIATPKIEAAPFFINWKTQQHPSQTSPSGCTMRTFEIADPKAAALNALLQATGMSLRATAADATRMRLVLQCGARTAEFTNGAQELHVADIDGLKIGYRTFGQLNATKSNAILVLTWFGGTSEGLKGWIGVGNLYDPTKYYVIVVDALGDGISSNPGDFTIRDMVRSQHELLTRELKIDHVYAVSGLSMGGMQTFQWVVSYPTFMTKAVAIVGTPKMTAYDLLLWKTELSLLDSPLGMKAAADINEMHLHTPAYIVTHTKDIDTLMQSHEESLRKMDPRNYGAQLKAMIAHDIGAYDAIRAKMLIVSSAQDHMVNPAPAEEFARATKSQLLILTGDCGHLATVCEKEKLIATVTRFLAD